MPALNCFPKFVQPLLDGSKVHTIRVERKRIWEPGDNLVFYKGLRTSQCELVCRKVCLKVRPIRVITLSDASFEAVELDGHILDKSQLELLIKNDGFTFQEDFFNFFDRHHSKDVRADKLRLIQWAETSY